MKGGMTMENDIEVFEFDSQEACSCDRIVG